MAKKQAPETPISKDSKPAKETRPEAKPKEQKPQKVEAKESRPNPITRFIRYVEASRAELRKVTWPSFKETRKATIAVLCFVGIMAILLGLIDLGLSSLIKTILS